jgi:hypothetical protein
LKCNPSCQSGSCRNGTCVCWPGYTGSVCNIIQTVNYTNPNLGINIAGLSYWSTQFPFMNYFYSSPSWISQYYPGYYNSTIAYTWNTNQTINTQLNGYPSSLNIDQKVGKLLLRDLKLKYPQGSSEYLLFYDG